MKIPLNDNTIFLFDLDGTLTKPRQTITEDAIKLIESIPCRWGIISGSDEKLMREQLGDKFDEYLIFACNGTRMYDDGKLIFSTCMRDEIGKDIFHNLNRALIKELDNYMEIMDKLLPNFMDGCYTGNFISNRGSMINLSFVGRGQKDLNARKQFALMDKQFNIRKGFIECIKDRFPDITFKLGGETGIDIYPNGWGKDYVQNLLNDSDIIIFFGDKLEAGGNDEDMIKIASFTYQVKDYKDCMKKLKELLGDKNGKKI